MIPSIFDSLDIPGVPVFIWLLRAYYEKRRMLLETYLGPAVENSFKPEESDELELPGEEVPDEEPGVPLLPADIPLPFPL